MHYTYFFYNNVKSINNIYNIYVNICFLTLDYFYYQLQYTIFFICQFFIYKLENFILIHYILNLILTNEQINLE